LEHTELAEINELEVENQLILILKEECKRTFICSECGYNELCEPTILPSNGEWFTVIYGSGVDFCTNCSKLREEFEETTDSPAYYYESEGEFTDDHQLQAET
jgi:hypothetical protein